MSLYYALTKSVMDIRMLFRSPGYDDYIRYYELSTSNSGAAPHSQLKYGKACRFDMLKPIYAYLHQYTRLTCGQ